MNIFLSAVFDSMDLTPIEKLQYAGQVTRLFNEANKIKNDPSKGIERIRIAKMINEIAVKLGLGKQVNTEVSDVAIAQVVDTPELTEQPIAKKASLTTRQKRNNAAIALLKQIDDGEVVAPLTNDQRETLQGYSGSGGGLTAANGETGSLHEYYTPKPVAQAMWDILGGMGFSGGKVLDPSAGMGIFAQTKPANVAIAQVELDDTSGKINGLLNNSETVSTTVSPFEAVASQTEDAQYDAIMTNVPFGTHAMRGASYKLDKKYQKADLQSYFLLRTLDKLKFGGFAAFIVPSSIVSGKGGKSQKLRTTLSFLAEFVGAYRLPNQVFDEAGADVITDVIVLRKHGKEQTDKINEIKQQMASVLTEANVLWDEFLSGNYFANSGKKFQIGESQVGMGKFGEVEKVVHTGDIDSVAKLMRPFDKTGRINWDLLDTTETMPITYKHGDTVYLNGALLQMTDGKLQVVDGGIDNDNQEALTFKERLDTPFNAIVNGVTFDDATLVINNETKNGRIDELPLWVRQAVSFGGSDVGFKAIIAGMCVQELNEKNGTLDGTKYAEIYPELSQVLAQVKRDAKKLTANCGNEEVLRALQSIQKATNKQGFTPWWNGAAIAADESITLPINAYDRAKQTLQDGDVYVSVDSIKADVPSFDPLNDDDWAISPDGGGVVHAKDYYQGAYSEFLARAADELENAASPEIKEKLLKQHAKALERLPLVNVSDMSFDLQSPYMDLDVKLSYLKQYVDADFDLTTNAKGERVFSFNGKAPRDANAADDRMLKLKKRLVHYLNNGTIRTATRSEDIQNEQDKAQELELQKQLVSFVSQTNSGFDAWTKSNDNTRVRLERQLNDPSVLRFTDVPDYAPLEIEGWNPERKPHGYQSAAVRRFASRFSGIMGLDVGLGKTLAALATVQHAHNIGTKKRTIFALPNSVLSNWKKEAEQAYPSTSDCLYVGLRQKANGKYKYDSSAADEDLASIVTGKFSKIFMTYEALGKIPMRDDTMEAYADYLLSNDDSIGEALIEQGEGIGEKGTKARTRIAQENQVTKAVNSGRKSMSVPYFEDMGVDSIVIDEAHSFKNSKRFTTMGEAGFQSTKYAPNPSTSDRGLDIQSKCWYIRGSTPIGDGVMALTATPITNSPLEIYSMLSLSIGEKDVNAMTGCTGANSFMNAVCNVEVESFNSITDDPRQDRVLKGIKNLPLVRRVLESACLIETAKSVAEKGVIIEIPESTEEQMSVELPPEVAKKLIEMKDRYKELRELRKAGGELSKTDAIYASPFNLIRNMTKLVIDPELFDGVFTFRFSKDDAEQAVKAVEAFNAKKYTEERREHELPHDFDITNIKTKVKIDGEVGEEAVVYYVPIVASIAGSEISMPAVTFDIQDKLVALLEKFKVEPIFVDSSPKISALIANVKDENANPRWKPAKQLIFCDELGLHHKLRFMVSAETGISASKIVIVNAKSVTPASLQEIQDGFNADGDAESDDENKYQIIIANKKAEVGINLQKGCQAIHHLTIGWTPDSTHQRNGRGVRQGNKIDTPIRVYHYDANGTFDNHKRHLVSVKSDWIGSIMDKDAKTVDIQGDLSQEDYENMLAATGDSQAMARIQKEAAGKAKSRVVQSNRIAQANAIANMQSADKWLEKFGGALGFINWAQAKDRSVRAMNTQASVLQDKLDKTESDMMRKRHSVKIAELDAKIAELESTYDGIMVGKRYYGADEIKDTQGIKNWEAEVKLNQKMRDEARNSFTLRDNAGYSKTTLEAIDKGDAVNIGGKLLSVGDIVEVRGGLGIVFKRGDSFYVVIQTIDGIESNHQLINLSVLRHAPISTPDYDSMAKELAQLCDKAVENGNNTSGAWSYSNAVLDSMVSVLPSAWLRAGNNSGAGFKSPLFPTYIGIYFGKDLDGELNKQNELIEINKQQSDMFRFKNVKDMVEFDGATSIKAWAIANERKITLTQRSNNTYYLIDSASWVTACDKALSMSKGEAQYKENLYKFMSEVEPAFDFVDYDTLKRLAGFKEQGRIDNDIIACDDGSEAAHYDVTQYMNQLDFIHFSDPLAEAVENGDAPSDLAFYGNVEESMKLYAKIVGCVIDGDMLVLDGKLSASVRQRLGLGLSKIPVIEYAPLLARLVSDRGVIGSIRATQAKKSLKDSSIDVDAVLAAVLSIGGGVQNAYIGKEPFVQAKTPWLGAFSADVGQYIKVSLAYGSDVNEKMMDKKYGLAGRSFDKGSKAWIFALTEIKTSDGKSVATVKDLLKFVGKEAEANQIFGA